MTRPVGVRQLNPLGICDLSGNVWGWCQNWYGDYPSELQIDPQGPASGSFRVLRGGSCSGAAQYCRAASRVNDAPVNRWNTSGFRLALSLQ